MGIRDFVYEFFTLKGFKLQENNTSESFGDYYDIYTNRDIYFRLVNDKGIESIDISNDNQNWYDLLRVKTILCNEKNLNKVTTFEEYKDFLQTEFANIATLFNDKNYPTTKKKFEELENERMNQMLSCWHNAVK